MKKYKIVLIVVGLFLASWAIKFYSSASGVVSKVVDPDNIVTSYEEFQNKFDAIKKGCQDLSDLRDLPDSGNSGGFSKEERILAKKNRINQIISEYNAASRQLTKNKWKNPNLPYQVSRDDFNNCN